MPPYSIVCRNRFAGLRHNFVAAAAYAWTTATTLTVQLHYVNWISAMTLVFDTTASTVTLTNNYGQPQIIPCAIVKQ